jgi:hypothetical protein
LIRVSPPKVDERGRKVPDRNGSRASDAVLLAASKISVNLRSELSVRGTRLVVQSLCGLGLLGRGPL